MGKSTKLMRNHASEFIAPEELAIRWRCARSSVDRITRREGMSRMYLGEGKNGMVRFLIAEVTMYEAKRIVQVPRK